jgi:hypothetical protein
MIPLLLLAACRTPEPEVRRPGPTTPAPTPSPPAPTVAPVPYATTTDPAAEVDAHALAVGDCGTGGTNQQVVADAMVAYCASNPCDFVLGLGDNVYEAGITGIDDPQLETAFEVPYAALDLVWYQSLGNHDYVGDEAAEVAYSAVSDKWEMPATQYAHAHGGVAFFAIDTVGRPDPAEIVEAIEASPARWKVAYGHYPLRTNGIHTDATGTLDDWLRTVLCNRVDLYLAGHNHSMEVLTDDCGVGLVVSGGGGAGSYAVSIEDNTLFALESYGFSVLDFSEDAVRIRFVDDGGTTVYDAVREKVEVAHSCGADAVCDQTCAYDADCAGLDCRVDGACEMQCSDDPDCFGACPCDYYGGICEAIAPATDQECGCDPTCAGDAVACVGDGHCDSWCPETSDPDC